MKITKILHNSKNIRKTANFEIIQSCIRSKYLHGTTFKQYMKSKLSIKYNVDVKIEDIKEIKDKFLKYKIFNECSNNICLREYIVYKK